MGFRISDIFSQYLRHNDINDYLDYLEITYPTNVTVIIAGHSYEGRPIKYIRITSGLDDNHYHCTTKNSMKPSNFNKIKEQRNRKHSGITVSKSRTEFNKSAIKKKSKSVILIDGGIHAREWIAVATALYCIYQLIEKAAHNQHLLRKLDFVILPVLNVDGYEYTHTNYKFWRKTRKPIEGGSHIGTDCNRNFDYHWKSACARASNYTFRGVTPFSEPETIILKSLMHSLSSNCKFYLSLHSYAKAFMYPWGYTKSLPSNWRDLHKLAKIGQSAIKEKTGSTYRSGSVSVLIRQTAAGGSPDYAFGIVKIPFVMTMELSGAGYGFHPPAKEIKTLVHESWIGIKAMCMHVADS